MLGRRADWFVSEKVTKAHNLEFAFKTHFPTAFLKVIFFVFLKFQFNHTGNFFMKHEMWRF